MAESAEAQYTRVRHALAAFRRATEARRVAWEKHKAAKEALKATGVVIEVPGYSGAARVTLPTERPWKDADYTARKAEEDLGDALTESPLILADIARLVGGE